MSLTRRERWARIESVVPHVVQQWACGAAGSALPWHGRGRRFDPDQVHQIFQIFNQTPINKPIYTHFAIPLEFMRLRCPMLIPQVQRESSLNCGPGCTSKHISRIITQPANSFLKAHGEPVYSVVNLPCIGYAITENQIADSRWFTQHDGKGIAYIPISAAEIGTNQIESPNGRVA